MGNFQTVFLFLILLILQVSKAQSSLEHNETQGDSQEHGYEHEYEYEKKYSVGDLLIPPGLIPADYNIYERPPGPRNQDGSISVKINAEIKSIPEFHEENGELSMDWLFSIIWKDNRFDEYSDKNVVDVAGNVILDPRLLDRIWNPRIHFNFKFMTQTLIMGSFLCITPGQNSRVWYKLRDTIQPTCKTDYTYYPLDVVVCPITIKSYLFGNSQVDLSQFWVKSKTLELSGFQVFPSGWRRNGYVYQERNFTKKGFKIVLKRDLTSSMIQFYIPSLVFIIICFGSFTLTAVSDRIACTTLSLLSLFVLLGSIGSTPQGPYVTFLHKWVLMCILIVFLPLLELFISLKLKAVAQRRAEKEEKQKAEAVNEKGTVHVDVEAPSVNKTSKGMVKPEEGEGRRKITLSKVIWLLEKATPVVVISTFFIYNIYYWCALISGSQGKFREHWDENSTLPWDNTTS